jgi:hypothetical protein
LFGIAVALAIAEQIREQLFTLCDLAPKLAASVVDECGESTLPVAFLKLCVQEF